MSLDNSKSKIIFFQVTSPPQKIKKIVYISHYHFSKKENLTILVSDDKALNYVDKLLWRTPSISFLPHISTSSICNDLIVITKQKENLNNSKYIFNLTNHSITSFDYHIIYDFEDLTSTQKNETFKKKFKEYQSNKLSIETHS